MSVYLVEQSYCVASVSEDCVCCVCKGRCIHHDCCALTQEYDDDPTSFKPEIEAVVRTIQKKPVVVVSCKSWER